MPSGILRLVAFSFPYEWVILPPDIEVQDLGRQSNKFAREGGELTEEKKKNSLQNSANHFRRKCFALPEVSTAPAAATVRTHGVQGVAGSD